MTPYHGFTKPSTIKLFNLPIWIQMHDLAVGFKSMVPILAGKVEEYMAQ
jgi:hypothetical protein